MMKITIAESWLAHDIAYFFQNHIQANHDGISNKEYLCPDGALASTRRGQVVVAIENDQIVGALRFYPKKSKQTISLYQFAIRSSHRGQNLLGRMLHIFGEYPVEVACPLSSRMNEYYEKRGWRLKEAKNSGNIWEWNNWEAI